MANAETGMKRPLSPHLQIYKFIPTYLMSGFHRVTGFVLYFGTLLLAAWLVAAAAGPETFAWASWFFDSWLGRLVLFGYTWTLMHHMLGGIRHLIWDTGAMFDKDTATKLAWATIIGSIILTLLIWIVGYMVL